jgi:hypothetical protein
MQQLNAAARLVAHQHKIVEGEGQRWNAVQFPNGRFGVIDTQHPSGSESIQAAGLDHEDAVRAVQTANKTGKWHPTLTMKR